MAELKDIYAIIKKEQPKLLTKQDNPNKHLHGFDLPFHLIVVGPSGSSKTSFVANLLMIFCEGKETFQSAHMNPFITGWKRKVIASL